MKHRKIEFSIGSKLETVMQNLAQFKDRGELVYVEFNGQKLYSDIDDVDSAYKKITGKTKAEFDEAERLRHEEYQEQQRKHKESIPDLTKEWIKKGNNILDERYHEKWAKLVPVRLNDLYQGMELGATLDIVKELNEGGDFKKAKIIIDGQGHSGMSFDLVCAMVNALCDRGEDFVNYIFKILN